MFKIFKVFLQDFYFCVKLKIYYFGMYCVSDDYIYCFFYDEIVGIIGLNEVIFFLDYLFIELENKFGKYDYLIIWCDNVFGQFKECFLFFYFDLIV